MLNSDKEMANVTITTSKTVYNYEPRFLFISYGLAILSSTAAVLLGSFAFSQNGVSHDATVSSIATAMRNPEVSCLSFFTISPLPIFLGTTERPSWERALARLG